MTDSHPEIQYHKIWRQCAAETVKQLWRSAVWKMENSPIHQSQEIKTFFTSAKSKLKKKLEKQDTNFIRENRRAFSNLIGVAQKFGAGYWNFLTLLPVCHYHTLHPLLRLHDTVHKALADQRSVLAVFLHIEKAYDL